MSLAIGIEFLEVKAAVGAIGNLVQEQLQMKCARLKCQVRLREGR